jgi:hypothetical protein
LPIGVDTAIVRGKRRQTDQATSDEHRTRSRFRAFNAHSASRVTPLLWSGTRVGAARRTDRPRRRNGPVVWVLVPIDWMLPGRDYNQLVVKELPSRQ